MMLILAFILNFIVAAWFYPELFVNMDFRMVEGHETGGPMQYVFFLIGQFYQGNIQLFNRYDLFGGSFSQLSVGLYTPFNFLVAAGYIILAPFVNDPAQFFHHWYVFAYYGLGLMLRTFGVYILTLYMTKSRLSAVLTSLVVNCFCAITMIHMGGVCISAVYNYLPLLLFCFVYYWDTRCFKAIIASVLIFLLAANHAMYVGFGFFYQTVHLFLFDMLMIWFLFQRRKKSFVADGFQWKVTFKAFVVAVLIFLPVWFWLTNMLSDFEMVGSGLGGSEGRFNRIYNAHAMLNDPLRYFVSSQEVFKHAYDFTISGWYLSGAFLGIATMVLAVIGLVLGKHAYKLIFITAAIMMAFLNVPSNQGGWMMWAHWVDAITNPFCFLVRSFHYAVLLWYLTLAVPIGLGIKACISLATNKREAIYANRVNVLKGILISLIVVCLYIPQASIKAYALKTLMLFLAFLVVCDLEKLTKALRIGLIGAVVLGLIVVEGSVLKQYVNTPSSDMNGAYWDGLRVKPRVHAPMYIPQIPFVLDYQNPKILPVRFFYRSDKQVVFPILWDFQEMFGQFYQFMPLALRMERPACVYIPRLQVFKGIDQDKDMQEYIKRDGRVMYLADVAIVPNKKDFSSVMSSGLDRRVVQAEGAYAKEIRNLRDVSLPEALPVNFKRIELMLNLSQAKKRKTRYGIEYSWPLPNDFPRYISTTILTNDAQLWQMSFGQQPMIVAQGALVIPWTFDVNNVRDGYLTALLPTDTPPNLGDARVTVLTPQELLDVWRNTHDEFGFTLNVSRDGWWVMHMPYDPKWELFIDGQKMPLAKINHYFIGAPLSRGEHQLLLRYWPNSPLRLLIIISTLTSLLAISFIFRRLYGWAHE